MSRVFFTSDLHLGHKNLVEGIRGMSVNVSDKLIIDNWNKVVTKRDIVYILGDITMEKKKDLEKLKQLNGTICVVGGNHDTKKICKQLQNLGIIVMGCLEYKGFICTHYPIHSSQLYKTRGNIHGHLHLTCKIKEEDLEGRYYNVNTEFHNYTPVLFDDIVKYFEGKEQKSFKENIFDKNLNLKMVSGCTADSLTINGKEEIDLTPNERKEIWKKIIKELGKEEFYRNIDEIPLNELLQFVLERFGNYSQDDKPCEQCGDWICRYELDIHE